MKERDYTLTMKDAFRYFNDEELNPHEELLKDFKLLLETHRKYIDSLSWSEYQEFKQRQRDRMEAQEAEMKNS